MHRYAHQYSSGRGRGQITRRTVLKYFVIVFLSIDSHYKHRATAVWRSAIENLRKTTRTYRNGHLETRCVVPQQRAIVIVLIFVPQLLREYLIFLFYEYFPRICIYSAGYGLGGCPVLDFGRATHAPDDVASDSGDRAMSR